MKKTNFYCLLAALCLYSKAFSQQALWPGDRLPAMTMHAWNGGSEITLGEGQDTIQLLDFFATWCGPCVAGLPKLLALQDSMHGKLQIILVSHQTEAQLATFFAKRPTISKSLKIVAADTLLQRYFPHRLLPHQVLLDRNGKVTAVTSHGLIHTASINKLLHGIPVQFPLKKDFDGYAPDLPLSQHLQTETERWQYQSVLTTAIEGTGSMQGIRKSGALVRDYYYNTPLLLLLQSLLRYQPELPMVFDAAVCQSLPQRAELREQLYCYESITPAAISDTMRYEWMWRDLSAKLGIRFTDTLISWPVVRIGGATGTPAVAKETGEGKALQQIIRSLQLRNDCRDAVILPANNYAPKTRIQLPPDFWRWHSQLKRLDWLSANGVLVKTNTVLTKIRLIRIDPFLISQP